MRRSIALVIGTIVLVAVRSTTAGQWPVGTAWWWLWLFGTVGIAACSGSAITIEVLYRTGRLQNGGRAARPH